MSNQPQKIDKDYIDGFVRIKPRWDSTQQKYVDSALFELFIYKHDPNTGEPLISGTRKSTTKDENGQYKEYPINPIAASYTIAISSLTKVLSKEARRCNIYWNKNNNRARGQF